MSHNAQGLSAEEVERLEALEWDATAAPWDARFAPTTVVLKKDKKFGFGPMLHPVCYLPHTGGFPEPGKGLIANAYSDGDKQLIAALRNAAPALITAAKQLTAANARIAELTEAMMPFAAYSDVVNEPDQQFVYARGYAGKERELRARDFRRAARLLQPVSDSPLTNS